MIDKNILIEELNKELKFEDKSVMVITPRGKFFITSDSLKDENDVIQISPSIAVGYTIGLSVVIKNLQACESNRVQIEYRKFDNDGYALADIQEIEVGMFGGVVLKSVDYNTKI